MNYKYSITINQKALIDNGLLEVLSVTDLCVLDAIHGMMAKSEFEKMNVDGKWFTWISYKKLMSQLPMLAITKEDTMYRRIKILHEAKVIDVQKKQEGGHTKIFIALTSLGDSFFNFYGSDKNGNNHSNSIRGSEFTSAVVRNSDTSSARSLHPPIDNNISIDNYTRDNNSPISPKKTFPAYGKGFVLEEQGATLKLLNQAAANTIVRYHEAVEKKLPSIEMTGYIFTEPFSIGLTYLGQKIRLDAVIEDLNVDEFDALKFEELFKHSKTVAHLGFLCFELYFSYLNMRKNDSFKSISGLVVM
jgi:hypothetical protein